MTVLGDVRPIPRQAAGTRVKNRIKQALVVVAVADLLILCAAVLLAWDFRLTLDVWTSNIDPAQQLSSTAGPWIVLLWMIFLAAQGAYSDKYFGTGPEEFKVVTLASLLAAGSVGMFCYLVQIELSRGFLVLAFVMGTPMLILERWAARKVLHRLRLQGRLVHRVVAVGGPSAITEMVGVLHRERYAGYEIVGACVPREIIVDHDALPVAHLGAVEDTRRVCEELNADTVLVARGGYSSAADLRRIAWDLEESEIDLIVAPSLTDVAGPRIHMRPVAGLPLLHVEGPQADEAGGFSKRAFDVAGALAALLVLSPIMITVAIMIKLEDRGPILFRQTRIGLHGQAFACLKFRSMFADADRIEAKLREEHGHSGALFKLERDPRVTRIGSFIRRYSLDELPQLINVVKGDMSLVGPRPQQAWEVETYNDSVRRRLLVRPGMTGLWQVSGRSSLTWDEAIRLDLYYVDNWSMVTDLVIMAKTVRAVVGSDGAY